MTFYVNYNNGKEEKFLSLKDACISAWENKSEVARFGNTLVSNDYKNGYNAESFNDFNDFFIVNYVELFGEPLHDVMRDMYIDYMINRGEEV